jgi:predicted RNA-binding protein associated with RNAse of E/G family
MPTIVYFTAVTAVTGKKYTIAVPDNYHMRHLGEILSTMTNVAPKEIQLSRHGQLLPHRYMETVRSASTQKGFQILVSSKKDAMSKSLREKTDHFE